MDAYNDIADARNHFPVSQKIFPVMGFREFHKKWLQLSHF
jgi:hypothetical protein